MKKWSKKTALKTLDKYVGRERLLRERDINLIHMYLVGNTMRQVADAFELTDVRVFQILKKNDIPRRPRGPHSLGRAPKRVRKPYRGKDE